LAQERIDLDYRAMSVPWTMDFVKIQSMLKTTKAFHRGFYSPESSEQDHALLVLLLNLVGFFISI